MLRTTASNRRIVIWNAAGSAVYALSSFLLLIIVIRVCGEVEGGIFSIGYAIAQLMLTVGVFESTTYFATDAGNRFSYAQYLAFKIVTCALMVAASAVYVLSFGFDAHKAAVASALVAYRLFEALAQYWFAAFQNEERLDLGGFSTVWRSVPVSYTHLIVIGSRFVDRKKPRTLRMAGSRLISFAIKLTTGRTIKDPTSGMR